MSDYSSYLFSTPSLWEGVGRLVDFGDTLTEYNDVPDPSKADARALFADFAAVGQDLMFALVSESSRNRATTPA